MESLWTKTAHLPSFERLEGDAKTDVLIIGGGLTGVLCAYMLRQAGVDCMLIEADRICRGVTGCTTAKLTSQHGLIYDKLIDTFGVEKARLYLQANEEALAAYRRLAQNISCDFEDKDAFVYSTEDRDRIEYELMALEKLGFAAEFEKWLPIPVEIAAAVKFPHQAQFHPLKFVAGLAKGLPIYEHTPARAFDGRAVCTDHGKITASHILVATHFPIFNKHGGYFLKLYQHRSYVLVLEGARDVEGMYVDERDTGLSFRNQGELMLLGGGAHRTGKNGGNWEELESFAKTHYPASRVRVRYATQDCMSLDGVPYIGHYAKGTPQLYVATGFNKWGMTSAMAAATLLCDMVQGKESPFAPLFSPSRSVWHPQLALNLLESALHLLTPTAPRCPHMGCALKWNSHEHSWDCPCHGSRFTKDGKLLDGPATGDRK